ncbi:type II secretion system protein, partial [Candidatus Saccharibacteria bacterium]|nr:type II secretion system protein [Candidatus Saccharibacteria bacterium]
MRKAISGFTIVEILVTVSLIGILAALSIISYDSITASAHDSKRQASFSVIQDALESYFNKNGEYPSCSAMSQDSNTVATSVLSDIDATVLTSPSSASGTNSFASSCADLTQGSTSDYAYISDTSKYTLEYKKESTGDIVAIESQHAPTSTVADPTSAPSVSISYTNG